jgi:hypothetical protein
MSDEIHPYIQLQQRIHHALRVSAVPTGLSRTAIGPTCDSYESRLADLLGLSPQTNSAMPGVATWEAICEIAWESDRRFA